MFRCNLIESPYRQPSVRELQRPTRQPVVPFNRVLHGSAPYGYHPPAGVTVYFKGADGKLAE